MSNSIKEAYETAMAKKSSKSSGKGGKGSAKGLVHPSFPPQAQPQPAYMGSQSASPLAGDPMSMMAGGPSANPDDFGGNGGGY